MIQREYDSQLESSTACVPICYIWWVIRGMLIKLNMDGIKVKSQ